jgi:hypothetical protein
VKLCFENGLRQHLERPQKKSFAVEVNRRGPFFFEKEKKKKNKIKKKKKKKREKFSFRCVRKVSFAPQSHPKDELRAEPRFLASMYLSQFWFH